MKEGRDDADFDKINPLQWFKQCVPPFDCFSVKDGEFRVYSGSRNEKEFIDYVEKEKWKTEEVLPGWKVANFA